MYEVHEWAKVRELYREGVSRKAIARRLGMSRNTVARLLASAEPPRYEREPAGSQLDPFKGAVLEMLREDASVPATVIREHLQREGYGGGITILKDYLASVRPQFKATPDFGRTTYVARRDPAGRLVGHRRRRAGRQGRAHARPRPRHDAALLGRPRRRLHALADHRRRRAGPLRLPRAPRRRAAASWSSTTTPASSCAAAARDRGPWTSSPPCSAASPWAASCCRRGAPQSKGSVERTNGYLETSFLPLRELRRSRRPAGAERRLDDRGRLARATTGASAPAWSRRSPWSAPSSPPLPDPPPATDRRLEVRVSRDGFVRVAGVDYSLPPGYAGRRVAVHLSLHELQVFCEGRRIAAHARSYVPADVVRDPAHMAALAAAQEAQRRLRGGEPELPAVDLARYDALVGAPL